MPGRELRARDPLAPAIVQSAVWVYEDLDDYDAVAGGRSAGHVYARYSNENVETLEAAVAEREGAEASLGTASKLGPS